MNFFDHKDLGNHLLQLCPKVVKHPVYYNRSYKNQLDALISQIYFWNKTHVFWTVPLYIIRSFSLYTQQWYMSYRLADIYHCCVYSEKLLMMYSGTVRNTQLYSKNKFEKLVHLVGFIIRIYHNGVT